MKKYKKVYLEITNSCNLACSFCATSKKPKRNITIEEAKIIFDKLRNYTDYLYFHVLGEPLLHPNINELINLAASNFQVNITTNGFLIRNIENNENIRQLNISLHSFNSKYNLSLDDYLNTIFNAVDKLKEHTYISYRIWVKSEYTNTIINKLNNKYNVNLNKNNLKNNMTIAENIFLSIHDEFTWPNLENPNINTKGNCYALKDHIGILVDGTIIPCCLDASGIINLGNIYQDNLEDIINSSRYQLMLQDFNNNCKREELCKRCNFLE